MYVVTYSDARKTFASLLDRAKAEGAVLIKRADGSLFRLAPEEVRESPFDFQPLDLHLEPGELAAALEEAIRGADPLARAVYRSPEDPAGRTRL